jgi:DNA primase
LLRDEYVRRLSGWLGFDSPEPVAEQLREHAERTAGPGRVDAEQPAGERSGGPRRNPPRLRDRQPDDAALAAEREAIKAALQRPGLAGPAFDALEPMHFTAGPYRTLREAIAAAGGVCSATDVAAWITRVATATQPDELRRMVTALAVEPLRYEGDGEEYYIASVVDRLQEMDVSRRIRDVKARVQRTNPVTEAEAFQRLFGELIALEERKRQLRERSLGPA